MIPDEEVIMYWDKAEEIMAHVDPEDVIFIAAALSQPNSIIWSDDRHFDKQNKITSLKTKEVLALLS